MWKEWKCSLIGGWVNKLWYIHMVKYYSVLTRNELSSHKKTRKKLKHILLGERSQMENVTYHLILTTWYSGRRKTMGTVKRSMVARGYGGEKEGCIGEILGTFEVNKVILCDTVTTDTIMHFSNPIEM